MTSGLARTELLGMLNLKLARVAVLRQDPVATETYLQAAFAELPADFPDTSLAWSVQSWLHLWRSEYEQAASAGDRALAVAREHGDLMLLNEAYSSLSQPALAALPGRSYRGVTAEWVDLASEGNDQYSLMTALSASVLDQLWISGLADGETLEQARQAVEIAQHLGSESGEQTARDILAACLLLSGRWLEARSELLAARVLDVGVGRADDLGAYLLGSLYTGQGRLERGRDVLAGALESIGFPHSRIWLNQALAWNRLEAEAFDEARSALERGSDAAERLGCRACAAYFSGVAAETWAALGDRERAWHYIALARDLGAGLERQPTLLSADRAEAALLAAENRWGEAARLLRRALKLARGIGQPFETARTSLQLGRALVRSGRSADQERASGLLSSAVEIFESMGAQEAARRAHMAAGDLSLSTF
jgi:tetratricopeptide (TPR) repeat protein